MARRPARLAATSAFVATAVAAAFVVGVSVGGGRGADEGHRGSPDAGDVSPVDLSPAAWAGPLATTSCAELRRHYVDRALEEVGPWGWTSPVVHQTFALQRGVLDAGAVGVPTAAAPRTTRAVASDTGTNVQEAGVDEPDQVKTDGALLVRISRAELATYDVTGARPLELGEVDLPGAAFLDDGELLLVGDRAVALGTRLVDGEESTTVLVVDLADPAAPEVVSTATYDTGLVAAVQHGDVVRLVLDTGLPALDFTEPRGWRRPSQQRALAHNRDVVRASTLDDWLPHVTTGTGGDRRTEPLLGCADLAVPTGTGAAAGLGTTAVVGLDPADPAGPQGTVARGLAAAAPVAYFSPDRLYLASPPDAPDVFCCWSPVIGGTTSTSGPDDGATRIFAFALDGAGSGALGTTYAASGEVDGAVADRWAMDEAGGVLRVAVGPTTRTGDANAVVTLVQEGDDLEELGRVDGLGPGETIRSVRWSDTLAIVVTFRQVDPLHTVDLTDPARPRLLGALHVPGFSEYLHPLGSQRLLGLGQATGPGGSLVGAQAALFAVDDVTDVRRIRTVHYPRGSSAGVATDPRQLVWLPRERLVLTVITSPRHGGTGWVSVLHFDGGPVEQRLVEVEQGSEVADVRLVPLPPAPGSAPGAPPRVVLVTGDGVSGFRI